MRTSPHESLTRIDYSETALSPPLKREADSPEWKSHKSSPRKKTSLTPGRVGVPINHRVGCEAESALAEDPSIELSPNKKAQFVKTRLAKASITVGNEVRKHISEELPILAEYEVYVKGLDWSPGHHKNMMGNLIRLMSYYANGEPYTFHPNMFQNVSKFYFVSTLEELNCSGETIKKYLEATRSFIRFLVFIDRYHIVQSAIMRIDRYAEHLQKHKNKVAATERKVRLSRSSLEQSINQLCQLVTDFNERLKPKVDAYFKSIEGKDRSEIAITPKELKMVNMYFFLNLGHRPCVFVGFPIDQYMAA